MGGECHEFARPVPRGWAQAGGAAALAGTVRAPMPGKIIKVRCRLFWLRSGMIWQGLPGRLLRPVFVVVLAQRYHGCNYHPFNKVVLLEIGNNGLPDAMT